MDPGALWWLVAAPSILVVLLFAARRVLLTATLWREQPPLPRAGELPSVLLLVPVRDESGSLADLARALDGLEYPRPRLRVVVIDDGSVDDGVEMIPRLADARPGWSNLRIDRTVGKAQALNLALREHDFGDVVYVFDADHRPRPDCLRIAVAAFADPGVGGVNGRMSITNPCASPAAFYGAMESLIHQLITVRGKDILGLAPPLLGSNTGYRRAALEAVGGFPPGAYLEDGDLTVALHRAGHRTRFLPSAVSLHASPRTLRGYFDQHVRWGRGFNDIAGSRLPQLFRDRRMALVLRIELALFALGYLDRLAMLALAALSAVSALRPIALSTLALALALPMVQSVCVLARERAAPAMWRRLPLMVPLFVLDVAAAALAGLLTVLRRDRPWRPTDRG